MRSHGERRHRPGELLPEAEGLFDGKHVYAQQLRPPRLDIPFTIILSSAAKGAHRRQEERGAAETRRQPLAARIASKEIGRAASGSYVFTAAESRGKI